MTLSETTSFNDQEHAQELFDSLIEDGHDSDEMKEFMEKHGHKDFLLYYEDYTRMVDEYDQETVDAFLEEFDLMDVEHLNDAYMDTTKAEQHLRSQWYLTWVTYNMTCLIGSQSTGKRHGRI